MSEFKKQYVLGEGYPWALGIGRDDDPYYALGLCQEQRGANYIPLNFPGELWRVDVSRYRLVLERVDD